MAKGKAVGQAEMVAVAAKSPAVCWVYDEPVVARCCGSLARVGGEGEAAW